MNPFKEFIPSIKNNKILDLFKEKNKVTFSELMKVWKYRSPISAMDKIYELISMWKLTNIIIKDSEFIVN